MASQWTVEQLKKFNVDFDEADTDKSGTLRFREVVLLLTKNGHRGGYNEAKRLFTEMDLDNDHVISRQEFEEAMKKLPDKKVKEMGMRKMFNSIDKDSSGHLTMKELNKAIQDIALDVDTERISNILIHQCQTSEKIDYEKFLELYVNQ
ncbi:16 kDa calcium-binding protein-like [Argonauta hians]